MFKIKNEKLMMYDISDNYRKYLSKYDSRVSKKENRKFYGILVSNEKMDYYIPFTSKTNKNTSTKLTINIKDGSKEIIAKLLLNNMIPVNIKDAHIVDINNSKYKTYYINEIRYLHNEKVIEELIRKLNYIFNVLENENHYDYDFFKEVCCNFKLLEEKCLEYTKK